MKNEEEKENEEARLKTNARPLRRRIIRKATHLMEGSSSGNNGSGDPDFEIFSETLSSYCVVWIVFKKPQLEGSLDCGFFCWYEPCNLQGRGDLRPMMVQRKKKDVRTVEQCGSSASMSISEEMQRTSITMQMKIEAMQKEIDAMQMRIRNGGKMNWNYLWIVVFCVVSYMCVKSSQ
ncbi:hypothetical protein RHSIM_Rhsim10G0164200 [Rhododendron simsii]|uniref:Uncharacterized protein n=1 Tax=Rhododendron simsii TaxID=118357 RepID=A0A834LCA6_RHOSS|nr:hypothetical protein RHSIM_Rhsim10G0164200 [Rhododendron simsii]